MTMEGMTSYVFALNGLVKTEFYFVWSLEDGCIGATHRDCCDLL